jgi:hypothetical protein
VSQDSIQCEPHRYSGHTDRHEKANRRFSLSFRTSLTIKKSLSSFRSTIDSTNIGRRCINIHRIVCFNYDSSFDYAALPAKFIQWLLWAEQRGSAWTFAHILCRKLKWRTTLPDWLLRVTRGWSMSATHTHTHTHTHIYIYIYMLIYKLSSTFTMTVKIIIAKTVSRAT